MKYKLSLKLAVTYLFTTIFLIITMVVITNRTFEDKFKNYIKNLQQEKNEETVQIVSNYYKSVDGEWKDKDLEEIGINALEEGLIIKITDIEDNVIWDAMEHNSGMCVAMLTEMAINMKKYYADFDGEYTIVQYDIIVNQLKVAEIELGYYGPYYLTENDVDFLKAFNNIIILIGLIAIISSIIIGIIISKKITKDLTNTIDSTKEIAKGNYKYRIINNSDTIEIKELIDAVNNLAKKLEEQEQMRNKLTSDIAHEIRTPIATLQSHLEALKDKVWEISEERIISLYEEIVRISEIVDKLSDLENFEKGHTQLNKTKFNIKELIKAVILNFQKEALDKQITIDFEGDDLFIDADKNKLKQVLVNLISNSLKYTKDNGRLKIKLLNKKTKYEIKIKDNGIGIPKDNLPYIFDRFYKVDKSRNRGIPGSGIGLSIVKSIINLHGGEIDVESTLGKGTTFIIILPI